MAGEIVVVIVADKGLLTQGLLDATISWIVPCDETAVLIDTLLTIDKMLYVIIGPRSASKKSRIDLANHQCS